MSTRLRVGVACAAIGLTLLTYSARAGSITYNFDTDPTIGATPIDLKTDATYDPASGTEWAAWRPAGGNPETGGFLALTYSTTYLNRHILFPDLDPGKVVTAFTFDCDLRVGNPSGAQGARAADGFSINFARSYDPVISNWDTDPGRGYRGDLMGGLCPACENASLPETGTTTGIAISFDTWSGNTLPGAPYGDGVDTEGIIVVVDNYVATKHGLPTRNGACADITSLQTGPQMGDAYWTPGGVASDPNAWTNLCWEHLSVVMDATGKLTVKWKGNTILDNYQTTYFPTAGRLLMGARTGGSDENTHIDNIVLTTTAVTGETQPPTDPTNLVATLVGSRRVALQWNGSVDRPDPQARVAYQVSRNGVVIGALVTSTNFVDAPGPDKDPVDQLAPSTLYHYSVLAVDLNSNKSGSATLDVTTAAEVPIPGYFTGQIYTNAAGAVIDFAAGWPANDPNFPASPGKQGWWLTGLSFGDNTGFGNTFGDTYGFRFAGTLTAPKTGQYRFFVRSDDASQFFFNSTGATLPDVNTTSPVAQEDDCCDPFFEPGQDENVAGGVGTGTFPTSAAFSLTAGSKYGFVWIMKEGGGGDWAQVAWRMEGDPTPAASLPAIGGVFVEAAAGAANTDPGGAVVTITQDPVDITAGANSHVNQWVAATTTSPWGYPAHYQWYKDGAPIMNANATNYYIDVLAPGDAGKYKAWVSVPGAGSFSKEATLTVVADTTPPTIAVSGIHGSNDLTHVTVKFSEPVTDPTATAPGNYTMEPALAVTGATRVDLYTIQLTTAAQAPDTKYTLTVNNVQDNAGLSIAPNTKADWMSFVVVGTVGVVKAEIYDGCGDGGACTAGLIPGTVVTNLTLGYAGYPASPDLTTNITAFNSRLYYPDDTHETYGARMTGLITPTVTGDYRFFTSSDDSSEVWLSTDATEANLVKIAEETGCCNAFTEPNSPRTSVPIHLIGGTQYLLRGIYKEGGGGDYQQIAWRKEGNPQPAASLTPIPGSFDIWVGPPFATTQPVSVAVDRGATATFTVAALMGMQPVNFQWQRLGESGAWTDIPGETNATLSIANVDASMVAAFRARFSNGAGTGASSQALLTLKNSFLIEAEDFNYDAGKHMAVADTMPYLNGAYRNLRAEYLVDYNSNNGFDSNSYRASTNFISDHNVDQNDNGGYSDRGGWSVTANYKLGWTGDGKWQNYTRQIPTNTYMVYAALSNGDTAGNAGGTKGTVGLVTGDTTTTNQTFTSIGVFSGGATGGWGNNALIPMQGPTTNGVAQVVALGGLQTLRFYPENGDFDWFMLVPAAASAPQFTAITVNANGIITVTWIGGGTLQYTTGLSPTGTSTWNDLTGATSPATIDPAALGNPPVLFGRIKTQ